MYVSKNNLSLKNKVPTQSPSPKKEKNSITNSPPTYPTSTTPSLPKNHSLRKHRKSKLGEREREGGEKQNKNSTPAKPPRKLHFLQKKVKNHSCKDTHFLFKKLGYFEQNTYFCLDFKG